MRTVWQRSQNSKENFLKASLQQIVLSQESTIECTTGLRSKSTRPRKNKEQSQLQSYSESNRPSFPSTRAATPDRRTERSGILEFLTQSSTDREHKVRQVAMNSPSTGMFLLCFHFLRSRPSTRTFPPPTPSTHVDVDSFTPAH